MSIDMKIVANADELARAAAEQFLLVAHEAVQERGIFTVVLSGGSTPRNLYSILAGDARFRDGIQWDRVHFFWGDERHVPPADPESNYRMANEAMLSKVPVPPANVHRIESETSVAGLAAYEYEQKLSEFFRLSEGQFPRFDLAFLGLGADGHTASLFPGTKALNEQHRLVVSNWVGKFYTDRITMTAPVFNHAAYVVFLVGGEDKAAPLKAVLEGNYEPLQLPAQLISPRDGRLLWIVDSSAARLLKNVHPK
jgi:6-phosphogluconolactonase